MELHNLSSAKRLRSEGMGRSVLFLAASYGVAALLFTAQGKSQSRIPVEATGQAAMQVAAEPTDFADAAIQVPAPRAEEANLAKPPALFSLSAAGAQYGQSTSQSATQSSAPDAPAATTSTKAAALKNKPPHRGLGIALAAIGTTALVLGVVAYAASRFDLCANEHSGGCQEARDAGLILMPVGGAVAVTGFYLQFHR